MTGWVINVPKGSLDFNSHAHVERDDAYGLTVSARANFNSHAHVERDLDTHNLGLEPSQFQLTRSRGA